MKKRKNPSPIEGSNLKPSQTSHCQRSPKENEMFLLKHLETSPVLWQKYFLCVWSCLNLLLGRWDMKKRSSDQHRTIIRYIWAPFSLFDEKMVKPPCFFAKSVHIMLVLPPAAQLNVHFWPRISSAAPPWGTWFRTHYWGIDRDEKIPAPGGNWTLDLMSFALRTCALPLCSNRFPRGAKLCMASAARWEEVEETTQWCLIMDCQKKNAWRGQSIITVDWKTEQNPFETIFNKHLLLSFLCYLAQAFTALHLWNPYCISTRWVRSLLSTN